jgi:hypothetical protein
MRNHPPTTSDQGHGARSTDPGIDDRGIDVDVPSEHTGVRSVDALHIGGRADDRTANRTEDRNDTRTKGRGDSHAGNGNGRPNGSLGATTPGQLMERWEQVQLSFVDDPRAAVAEADHLVQAAMDRVTRTLAIHRDELEHAWSRGEQVSTEQLRTIIQEYRQFLQQLVAMTR